MTARKIAEGIFSVGSIDWNRRLFDELIPLPDGTSYNSYIVKGSQKTALMDSVDPPKEGELKQNLKELGIDRIDYVVCHHAEQDHSGSIGKVLEWFPAAKAVTNEKCKGMLKDLLLLKDEQFIVISDKQTLSLGDKTLEFVFAPWVHWPETMVTYLKEDKILFSCDFFGSHRAQSGLYVEDGAEVLRGAKRYYAEIMMPFRAAIKGHLEKLKAYDVKMICPSHGPVYREPALIIDAYKDWTGDAVKNEVIVPYVSMHGSTRAMVDHFLAKLIDKGITVKPFDLPKTDIGELAMSLVDAATVVIGSPAVLAGPHPLALYAAYLANALRPKTRFASIIGSFGWGSKMVETLAGTLTNLKVEILEPVIVKGYPKDADFEQIEGLADRIAEKHKTLS